MANIDRYLQAIMSAVYGRDVRSSIHDAIAAINNDVNKKFDVSDLDSSLKSATKPAQAKAVGDAISAINDGLDDCFTVSDLDNTLSSSILPAQAKAVGDAINAIEVHAATGYTRDEVAEIFEEIAPDALKIISLSSYGVVGDGVTDDWQNIQKCLDDNPCATIFFAPGVYKITKTLEVYNHTGGQTLFMGGARLLWDGPAGTNTVMMSITKSLEPSRNSVCRIYGGTFDGNQKVGTCLVNNGYYTDVGSSRFQDFRYAGIINGDPSISHMNILQTPNRTEYSMGDPYSVNGLTFDADTTNGRVTVTGTATANTYYYMTHWITEAAVQPILNLDPDTTYTVSGCPAGGSDSTYSIGVTLTNLDYIPDGSPIRGNNYDDIGSGYTFTGYKHACIRIEIMAGYSCPEEGLLFKPRLEFGSVVNSDNTIGEQLSLQAKFHDLHIFQVPHDNWAFSEGESRAIICLAPDSQFSNIVTHRTKIAYEFNSGGNSFVNCHSTIDYADWSVITPNKFGGIHIFLNPPNSGMTQDNLFTNMYFNVGKYVVYAARPTRLVTNISTSHYTFYKPKSYLDIVRGAHVIICGGAPSDFRCHNIDCIVGPELVILDYYPHYAPGSFVTMPDKLLVNSNARHVEAHVLSAYNLQPDDLITPVGGPSFSEVTELETLYEIGAVLIWNQHGEATPFKLGYYNEAGKVECTIGFRTATIDGESVLTPYVKETVASGPRFTDFLIYIAKTPTTIRLEKLDYDYYPIYMKKTQNTTTREYVYASSNGSPFVRCYIRNGVSPDHTIDSDENLLRLPRGKNYKNLLIIGDSYCAGYTPDGANSGWGRLLANYANLAGWDAKVKGVGSIGFVDRQVEGHEYDTFEHAIQGEITPYTTDVVICGGFNDQNQTVEEIRNAISSVVTWLRATYPGIGIYVGCCAFSTNTSFENKIVSVSRPGYRSIGTFAGGYLDIEDSLDSSVVASDGFHPTLEGNTRIAANIMGILLNN